VSFTRRGWSFFGAALGLLAGGRLLGLPQLWILATATLALLTVSAVWTNTRRLAIGGERRPTERLQVGVEGRVDLVVVNNADHATPTLALTDSFDRGRRSARFLLAPLHAGEVGRAAYRVPTDRRGRFELGPLSASCADPFGLCERTSLVADRTEVLVYPRVHDILALPELGGDDLDSHAAELVGRPDVGGEFHLLREYNAGDDLRRVHWKATARRSRLMVRQDESKRRAPVLVLLDVRSGHHDRASFELAVEATASIATALERARRPYSVMTSSGEALGHPGQRYLATVLDALAVIEPVASDRLVPALAGRSATAVAFVTGRVRDRDGAALDLMVRVGGGLAIVTTASTESGSLSSHPTAGHLTAGRRRHPPLLISLHSDQGFTAAWNTAVLLWQRPDRTTRRATTRR
jgi:uncharacterized protein (DUF58 family)